MKKLLLTLVVVFMAGCALMPLKPQKGGSASVGASVSTQAEMPVKGKETASVGALPAPGIPSASITQSENPQGPSGQSVSYEMTDEVTLPYDVVKTMVTEYPDGRKVTITEPMPAGTKVSKHIKQNVDQSLGGSWKDTAREMAAALGSFAAVQYVGIAFLLFGAVSFFNLAIRTLIGGKDVSMAIGGCGLVMMFGPFLFVTYAKWFFLAIVLVGAYWVIARLKYKEAIADTLSKQPK